MILYGVATNVTDHPCCPIAHASVQVPPHQANYSQDKEARRLLSSDKVCPHSTIRTKTSTSVPSAPIVVIPHQIIPVKPVSIRLPRMEPVCGSKTCGIIIEKGYVIFPKKPGNNNAVARPGASPPFCFFVFENSSPPFCFSQSVSHWEGASGWGKR